MDSISGNLGYLFQNALQKCPVVNAKITGQEIEEYESEYGLKDELKRFSGQALFFAEHYPIQVSARFKFQLTVSVNPLVVVGW
jgi:hypothetical protein